VSRTCTTVLHRHHRHQTSITSTASITSRLLCILHIIKYDHHLPTYHFNGPFPSESELAAGSLPFSLLPPLVPEENLWGEQAQVSYRPEWCSPCAVPQPTVSNHWRKLKALTPTSGLALSFLHPPTDSWIMSRWTSKPNIYMCKIIQFKSYCLDTQSDRWSPDWLLPQTFLCCRGNNLQTKVKTERPAGHVTIRHDMLYLHVPKSSLLDSLIYCMEPKKK